MGEFRTSACATPGNSPIAKSNPQQDRYQNLARGVARIGPEIFNGKTEILANVMRLISPRLDDGALRLRIWDPDGCLYRAPLLPILVLF